MYRDEICIVDSPLDINQRRHFFRLNNFLDNSNVLLKLEWLNPAGSIKIKPALQMINDLENRGFFRICGVNRQ